MQPVDLLSLENHLGIPPQLFLEDTLSVIIPIGPGHPDDSLDEYKEPVDVDRSRALISTIEILAHNATGRRPIQVIIIDSTPASKSTTSAPNLSVGSSSRLRLRPDLVSIVQRHYAGEQCLSESGQGFVPPRRGELIRYAVDRFARGSTLVFVEPGVQLPQNWDSAVHHCLQRPDVGMGCFAYRLHLYDKYIYRKSVSWAINSWLANYLVNAQTRRTQVPIVGQPLFIYTHYLACLGGYPQSSHALHPIDLALLCQAEIGQMAVTCPINAAAGVPADFALRHGAYRTTWYTLGIALARYLGASEKELHHALSRNGLPKVEHVPDGEPVARLPLVRPAYLDGY